MDNFKKILKKNIKLTVFLIGFLLLPFVLAEENSSVLNNLDMNQVKGTTIKLWDYFKIALDYFQGAVMWVATFINKYIDFPVENIYMVLLGLFSLILVSKIFYTQNTTIRGRGLSFFIWVIIVFLILKFL